MAEVESSADTAKQETEGKKKRRRKVKRKKAAAEGTSADGETSADQAKPKKKAAKRTRKSAARKKKDGAETTGEPSPETTKHEKPPPAASKKTTGRKRTRKKKQAKRAGAAAASEDDAAPADAAAPPPAQEPQPDHAAQASFGSEGTEAVKPTEGEVMDDASVALADGATTADDAPQADQDSKAEASRSRRRRRNNRKPSENRPPADTDRPPTTLQETAQEDSVPKPAQNETSRTPRRPANEAFGAGLISPPDDSASGAPARQPDESTRTRPEPLDDLAAEDSGDRIPDTRSDAPKSPADETDRQPAADTAKAEQAQDDRTRRRRRRGGRGRRRNQEADAPAKPSPVSKVQEQKAAPPKEEASQQESAPSEEGSEDISTDAAPGEREMVINVSAGDECRIAVLEGGRLEELFIERQSAESHVGSIFKGRVTNVEPSIQAVFVDFGRAKNGFLHISDVHPQYFPGAGNAAEDVGRKIPRRERPPIQKCFRRGQEVVVQVTKEGIGTKGPTLTSYLSIPGRFLVMMPGMNRLGVSRKIEDDADRRAMRDVLNQLELPDGMGFILRTAGLGRTKRELQRDLNYLARLWKIISDRIRKSRSPAEVYQESDLVIRTIRDVLTSDFKRVVVDHPETAENVREFLKIALPRTQDMVEFYSGHEPLFHKFGVEEEIERINSRHVPLPLGGSIVIDTTEAMVAIDVNSGKFRDVDDAEESAFQLNIQAAEEIARQLRLRDLGGLIVCDFIDMRLEKHKRAVERSLRNALKKHKERARILRMSQFGLIEITRQRQRSSIRRSIYTECPHCKGSGMIKSAESMVLEVMRVLQLLCYKENLRKITVTVSPEVAFMVQNARRSQVYDLEQRTDTGITIRGDRQYALDQIDCECEDVRGRAVTPPL